MINIEDARVSEVRRIKDLLFETWSKAYQDVLTPEQIIKVTSKWHSRELLTKQVKDSSIKFLVAREGGNLVAMCNTGKIEGDHVEIQRLHVKPSHQRRGLGTRLLNEIIKQFPKHSKFHIEVEETNTKAIDFYEKYGFKKAGKIILEIESVVIPCITMSINT